jgi:hypothetical protein
VYQLQLQAVNEIPQPVRPDRWDQAIVARYVYDLMGGLV